MIKKYETRFQTIKIYEKTLLIDITQCNRKNTLEFYQKSFETIEDFENAKKLLSFILDIELD